MFGGRNRARTYDPLLVRQMLSQLSYTPKHFISVLFMIHYLISSVNILFFKDLSDNSFISLLDKTTFVKDYF